MRRPTIESPFSLHEFRDPFAFVVNGNDDGQFEMGGNGKDAELAARPFAEQMMQRANPFVGSSVNALEQTVHLLIRFRRDKRQYIGGHALFLETKSAIAPHLPVSGGGGSGVG